MAATIIDGKAVAARVREEVARDVAEFTDRTGRTPGLATILVGEDPAARNFYEGAARLYERLAADFDGDRKEIAALDAFCKPKG